MTVQEPISHGQEAGEPPIAEDVAAAAEPPARSSVLRNVGVLFGSQGVTWVLSLVLLVVLPRFLGPSAVGQYRIAVSLWAIGGVFMAFGVNTEIIMSLARARTSTHIVGTAIIARLLLFVVSLFVVTAFVVLAGYDRETIVIVLLFGLVAMFATLSEAQRAAFYGLERMGPTALADIGSKIFMVAAVLIALLFGAGVGGVVVISAVTALIASAIMFSSLRKVPGIRFSGELKDVLPLLRAGWPFLVIDVVLVLYMQVDTVVISLLASTTEVGWYTTADTLFASLMFIPVILMASLFPVMTRVHANEPGDLEELVRRIIRGLVLVAVPIGLGIALLATPVATLLYGPEFAQTGPILALMGVTLLLTYPTILCGRVALVMGRQGFWAALMLLGTGVSIALDVVLVPWCARVFDNGAIAGAISYLVTEFLLIAIAVWKLVPYLFDSGTVIRITKCLVAGLLMAVCVLPVRHTFIAIPVVVGAIAYTAAIVLQRTLSSEERAVIGKTVARLLPGRAAASSADGLA